MLPVLELSGTPLERGLAHGRLARARVRRNVRTYFRRFEEEALLAPAEALSRAETWWQRLVAHHPGYADAVLGVSEGAELPLLEVVALNVRYELLYSQFTANAMSDACSAFSLLPERTSSGHTLLGQNWDWIPEVEGVVLRERFGEDTEVLCFSEAGIVGGKIGLNSHGVGLTINGITSTDDDWSRGGAPFHVRSREILRSRSLAEAIGIVEDEGRACSTNFVLAQAGAGAVSIEASPGGTCAWRPREGSLAHTNHFLDPARAGIEEPPNPYRPSSVHRLDRLWHLLDEGPPKDVSDLMRALRDHEGHPNSVCRHPDPERVGAYETVTSVIMDLDEGALWVSDGPPCGSAYQELRIGTPATDP